ncbi:MAG: cysteine desulfurase family protein [Oscillospiraceae bacterium]
MGRFHLQQKERRIRLVYFDNAATTQPCPEAVQAVTEALEHGWGNPSSLHSFGLAAQKRVDGARAELAAALGALPEEIVFTSCATESTSLALLGCARTYGRRKRKLVISGVEHPATAATAQRLEEDGFTVVRIAPENGMVSPARFAEAVDDETFLVSCMLVNNETGAQLPAAEIFAAVKRKNPTVVTHCDAVQGFLKQALRVKQLDADLISVSGHKVYAPKGVGALFVKKGIRLAPVLLGGGQERGLRSGTEAVPLIAGFGAAVKALRATVEERDAAVRGCNAYLRSRLAELDGVRIHSDETASPYILSIGVKNMKAEPLLHFLAQSKIYVSSGSACAKGKKSGVLEAFGINAAYLDSTIRVSFSHQNTRADCDALCDALTRAMQTLCGIRQTPHSNRKD